MTLKLKSTNFINIKALYNLYIDCSKIVVSNKLPFGKQDFKYFIGYQNSEKLDLYANSVNKWLYITETFMKIGKFIF